MVLGFYSGREIECNTKRVDRIDNFKMGEDMSSLPSLSGAPMGGGLTEQQHKIID